MARIVRLRSCDGHMFEVEESAAVLLETIKNLVEDGCTNDVIPLNNVDGVTLAKVIEWCRKQLSLGVGELESNCSKTESSKALEEWEQKFIDVDTNVLYDIIMASNYLEVKKLLDLGCQKVADMIKGKSPEQIRKLFNIQNDFTLKEEKKIRKKNAWAFQK